MAAPTHMNSQSGGVGMALEGIANQITMCCDSPLVTYGLLSGEVALILGEQQARFAVFDAHSDATLAVFASTVPRCCVHWQATLKSRSGLQVVCCPKVALRSPYVKHPHKAACR